MYLDIATTQPLPQVTSPPVMQPISPPSQDKPPQVVLWVRNARFKPQWTPSHLRIMPQVRTRVNPYTNQLIYLFLSSCLDRFKRNKRPLPPRRLCDSRLWSQQSKQWFTSRISTVSPCFNPYIMNVSQLTTFPLNQSKLYERNLWLRIESLR